MSNDLRAENRRHRRNEKNQANQDEINRCQNEKNQANQDETNCLQNERNQARPEHIRHEMHRIARNNIIKEGSYLGEMNHICLQCS